MNGYFLGNKEMRGKPNNVMTALAVNAMRSPNRSPIAPSTNVTTEPRTKLSDM